MRSWWQWDPSKPVALVDEHWIKHGAEQSVVITDKRKRRSRAVSHPNRHIRWASSSLATPEKTSRAKNLKRQHDGPNVKDRRAIRRDIKGEVYVFFFPLLMSNIWCSLSCGYNCGWCRAKSPNLPGWCREIGKGPENCRGQGCDNSTQ